jgi:lysyl-tRNA synthetase class 1
MTQTELTTAAQVSKSWPFEEARKLVKRYPGGKRDASGAGAGAVRNRLWPSGLPHIGTFQEVLRTTLVRASKC